MVGCWGLDVYKTSASSGFTCRSDHGRSGVPCACSCGKAIVGCVLHTAFTAAAACPRPPHGTVKSRPPRSPRSPRSPCIDFLTSTGAARGVFAIAGLFRRAGLGRQPGADIRRWCRRVRQRHPHREFLAHACMISIDAIKILIMTSLFPK